MLEDFGKQPGVRSPDGTSNIKLTRNYDFEVRKGPRVLSRIFLPDISSNIEVGWSPDSTQFFISYSDGGAIGGYHVRLYRLTSGGIVKSKAPVVAFSAFKAKHWCKERGDNLFFLDWTPDSKIAFFVTEVYPTGDCGKELGLFRGYAVDVSQDTIVHTYGEKETNAIEKACRASGTLSLQDLH